MKRILTAMIIILIIATGVVSFPGKKVFACSCVGGDAKEKLERSVAVFVGKVIDKGGTKKFQHGQLREYTFDVDRAWKGVNSSQMTIYSYDGSEASCGFEFEKGQSYLVYSYQDKDNTLQTNLCSGNILVSKATGDIEQLGSGTKISKDDDKEQNHDRKFLFNNFLLGGVILIVGLAFLIIWKYKKRNRFS